RGGALTVAWRRRQRRIPRARAAGRSDGFARRPRRRGRASTSCRGCAVTDLAETRIVGLVPHRDRPLAHELAQRTASWLVEVDVESVGPARGSWYALNETVVERLRSGHLIYLDVSINGSAFTSYAADGLIVATPTGSTAYSFSAGGPIASPDLRCIVLTPISPHMLFDRSLVFSEHDEVAFVVVNGRNVALTIDGRELGELCSGDRVRCRV